MDWQSRTAWWLWACPQQTHLSSAEHCPRGNASGKKKNTTTFTCCCQQNSNPPVTKPTDSSKRTALGASNWLGLLNVSESHSLWNKTGQKRTSPLLAAVFGSSFLHFDHKAAVISVSSSVQIYMDFSCTSNQDNTGETGLLLNSKVPWQAQGAKRQGRKKCLLLHWLIDWSIELLDAMW